MENYTRFEDREPAPRYTEGPRIEAEYIQTNVQTMRVNGNNQELSQLCICVSILNFICFPLCGIPALIFTVFGFEADKVGDKLEGRKHAKYVTIFNLLGLVLFIVLSLSTLTSIVLGSFLRSAPTKVN